MTMALAGETAVESQEKIVLEILPAASFLAAALPMGHSLVTSRISSSRSREGRNLRKLDPAGRIERSPVGNPELYRGLALLNLDDHGAIG